MKKFFASALAAFALASPALAQDPAVSGAWRLSANVASHAYSLLCRFEQNGDKIEGACVDSLKHRGIPLTAGRVDGDHVTFTHRGSFLLNKFDVNYAGTLDGDRMSGRIDVFGHTGDFTAVRDLS